MLEKLTEYLKRKGWVFTQGKLPNLLILAINGFNSTLNCVIDADEEDSMLLFISFNGTICPEDKRLQLAELLTRINYNLRYGNFEMGIDNGQIKFRTSLYTEDIELTDKIIDNIIIKNIYTHDFSFPFLSRFLFGQMTMDEVYDNLYPKQLENKKQDDHLLEE